MLGPYIVRAMLPHINSDPLHTESDTLVVRLPFRPARFSHDSNILRKYGTEGAGHLRYSPLMNA
jgi:hypothetical protein